MTSQLKIIVKSPLHCGSTEATKDSRQQVSDEVPPSALPRTYATAKNCALYISWENALDPPKDCGEPWESRRATDSQWEQAFHELRLNYVEKFPKSKFRLIHAYLEFYSCLPKSAWDFVLTLSNAKEQDESTGRFPLHIAASINDAPDCEVARIVDSLLKIYPEAARRCDHNGRYPLQEAIASGKFWDSATFKLLLKANPDVINEIDGATGECNAMLAATSAVAPTTSFKMHTEKHIGFAKGSKKKTDEEICQHCNKILPEESMIVKQAEHQTFNSDVNTNANVLGTIYELLLADPQAIFRR